MASSQSLHASINGLHDAKESSRSLQVKKSCSSYSDGVAQPLQHQGPNFLSTQVDLSQNDQSKEGFPDPTTVSDFKKEKNTQAIHSSTVSTVASQLLKPAVLPLSNTSDTCTPKAVAFQQNTHPIFSSIGTIVNQQHNLAAPRRMVVDMLAPFSAQLSSAHQFHANNTPNGVDNTRYAEVIATQITVQKVVGPQIPV
ncbi:hypothetical protein F0562_017707 [Nyssa sinensis]|uniref:Uncharacterized protein n=1 Tax=Nyssa sinensis TaxID=561372 RepID=A0A5J4ZHP6_9ASTE|nr:hypothetical protein F0562_017707 [Nyssa sinensis]